MGAALSRPAEVVAWYGAVQAQEYEPAKWALALRMPDGSVDADVERAFETGRILRTHVMRPTWHFVTPADIRWMLELTAPRVHRVMSSYNRQLGLDARGLVRGIAIIERAIGDEQFLTRRELGERLQRRRLTLDGVRLAQLTMHAELEGIICSGPRRGKQSTYALVAERAPKAKRLSRDEALATLASRFFRSHGPATVRDFVWWSGLTTADAKRALEMNRARKEEVDGWTYWTIGPVTRPPAVVAGRGLRRAKEGRVRERAAHLLPIYDEFLVAYRDRDAVPHGPSTVASGPRASVTFRHALAIAGQVAGTWRTQRSGKTPRTASGCRIDVYPMRRLTSAERRAVAEAAERYARFLSVPVDVHINSQRSL
jgi:hypothetical protein